MENFELKGDWFIPQVPTKRVKGILKFDTNSGSTLEIFGRFDDIPIYTQYIGINLINGITTDSKYITLYNAYLVKSVGTQLNTYGESGNPHNFYRINYIFVAKRDYFIEDIKELYFHKSLFEINEFDAWLGVSGFGLQPLSLDIIEMAQSGNFELKYSIPDSIPFEISEDLKGLIYFTFNPGDISIFNRSANWFQKTYVCLENSNQISLKEITLQVFHFQNLLLLSTIESTNLNYLELHKTQNSGHKDVIEEYIVYFPLKSENKRNPDFLFTYRDIKDSFENVLRNWYRIKEKLDPALNLLFEHIYFSERFTENTFLNLAQSIESLHARLHDRKKMPSSEFKKMVEDILSRTPKIYHQWIEAPIYFGNNLTLHERLEEMIEKYLIKGLDEIIINKEKFINQIKWSRNYYTHYDEKQRKKALRGTDLYYLTKKLQLLIVLAILIEIGIEKKQLEALFKAVKHRFLFLKQIEP